MAHTVGKKMDSASVVFPAIDAGPRIVPRVQTKRARATCPRSHKLPRLRVGQDWLNSINRIPRSCGLKFAIDVVNILHALGLQPFTERGCALLGIDWNTIDR